MFVTYLGGLVGLGDDLDNEKIQLSKTDYNVAEYQDVKVVISPNNAIRIK